MTKIEKIKIVFYAFLFLLTAFSLEYFSPEEYHFGIGFVLGVLYMCLLYEVYKQYIIRQLLILHKKIDTIEKIVWKDE